MHRGKLLLPVLSVVLDDANAVDPQIPDVQYASEEYRLLEKSWEEG